MTFMPSYWDAEPRQRAVMLVALVVWFAVCAVELERAIDHPSKLQMCFGIACIALPIVLLRWRSVPIWLFAVYAALVPFASILETAGGQTLTKLLGIVAGALLIVSIAAQRRVTPPGYSLAALFALTAYAGLTICWAIDPALALSTYFMYLSYAGLYVVVALYPARPAETRLVIGATIVGALSIAAYGGFLFWHGQQVYESRLGIGFADAYWIDSNEYAAAMLTPLAIVLVTFLRTRALAKKSLWGLALVVMTAGFVVSGSRGGLFGFAAALAYLTLRSKYRAQLLAIVPAVVLAVIASPIGHRLLQPDLLSADLRTDIWKVGIASLQQYWFAGAGIGNFNNAYAQYFLATPHAALSWDRVAHSILLQSAVEYGIPGLVLLLAFWYTQFTSVAREQIDESQRDLSLALQAGVLGLFVAGLSLSLMLAKYTWLAFSLIALTRSSALAQRPRAANLRRASTPAASAAIARAIEA